VTTAGARKSDKWIPWYFVLFFAVFIIVDVIFATLAMRTHSGVVSDQAYEKGLAFNETLNEAREQSQFIGHETASYQDNKLVWRITGKDGHPLQGGRVTAHLVRRVQEGYDFTISLAEGTPGYYAATPSFPLPGEWIARLEMIWNNKSYRTILPLMVTDTMSGQQKAETIR